MITFIKGYNADWKIKKPLQWSVKRYYKAFYLLMAYFGHTTSHIVYNGSLLIENILYVFISLHLQYTLSACNSSLSFFI